MSATDPALAAVVLGAQVRHLRLERGISQKRLAFEAGVTMETIGRMERGRATRAWTRFGRQRRRSTPAWRR